MDLDPEWRQKKGKKFYVIEGKKVEKNLVFNAQSIESI